MKNYDPRNDSSGLKPYYFNGIVCTGDYKRSLTIASGFENNATLSCCFSAPILIKVVVEKKEF